MIDSTDPFGNSRGALRLGAGTHNAPEGLHFYCIVPQPAATLKARAISGDTATRNDYDDGADGEVEAYREVYGRYDQITITEGSADAYLRSNEV